MKLYQYTYAELFNDQNTFTNILNAFGFTTQEIQDYLESTTNINIVDDLFLRFITIKYHHYFWVTSDRSDVLDLLNEDEARPYNVCGQMAYKMFEFYNATNKKYKLLLDGFNKSLTDLMKQISTTSNTDVKSITNDTPQAQLGSDLFSDNFASLINHLTNNGEVLQDAMPYLDKLTELNNKYVAVMDRWANEFESYLDGYCAEGYSL